MLPQDPARSAFELHSIAVSIRERVELVAEQVAGDRDPGLRGLSGLLRSTLELRASVCELLMDAADDGAPADVDELRRALEVLTATLTSVKAVLAVARAAHAAEIAAPGARCEHAGNDGRGRTAPERHR